MPRGIALLSALAAALALGAVLLPRDGAAEEGDPAAGVDYFHRVAWATGAGADLAAVRRHAAQRLLACLSTVPVTSGETVGGIVAADSAIKAIVEGAVREAPLTITSREGGRLRGVLRLSLDGEVIRALLPPVLGRRPSLRPEAPRSFTGLVVDARGLPLSPSLGPRLLGPDGEILYGPEQVAEEAAGARGVVAWTGSMSSTRRSERLGRVPRVIRAVGARGADLAVSEDAAQALRPVRGRTPPALVEARVTIVTDRDRLRVPGPPPDQTAP